MARDTLPRGVYCRAADDRGTGVINLQAGISDFIDVLIKTMQEQQKVIEERARCCGVRSQRTNGSSAAHASLCARARCAPTAT